MARRSIKVIINQSNTGQLRSTEAVTVSGMPVTANRLDTLGDVNATTEVEGGVPRYDVETDRYVVEKLGFSDITGDPGDLEITEIDGGTF